MEVAEQFVARGYLVNTGGGGEPPSPPFTANTIFKFRRDEDRYCLNSFCFPISTPPMMRAVEDLRRLMSDLHSRFISESGVDYAGMKKSEEFRRFRLATVDLQACQLTDLPRGEEDFPAVVAFYINLYNCLILSGEVAFGHPKWALERRRFWRRVSFRIGEHKLSCEDIEHGILRCNRSGQFPPGDPRLVLVLPKFDYRIHFALNCGARSCPPIRVYTAKNIEKGLRFAFEQFMLEHVTYNATQNVLTLSRLLQWYAGDFLGDTAKSNMQERLVAFVRDAMPADHALRQVASTANIKVVFEKYDWSSLEATTPPSSGN